MQLCTLCDISSYNIKSNCEIESEQRVLTVFTAHFANLEMKPSLTASKTIESIEFICYFIDLQKVASIYFTVRESILLHRDYRTPRSTSIRHQIILSYVNVPPYFSTRDILAIVNAMQAQLTPLKYRITVRKVFLALKSWRESASLACDYRFMHFFLSELGDQKRE